MTGITPVRKLPKSVARQSNGPQAPGSLVFYVATEAEEFRAFDALSAEDRALLNWTNTNLSAVEFSAMVALHGRRATVQEIRRRFVGKPLKGEPDV